MSRVLSDRGWGDQVRKDMAEIDMGLIQEAMDKRQLGLPNPRLPPSEAKTRMATVQVPACPASCHACVAVCAAPCCAVLYLMPGGGDPAALHLLQV